MMYNDGVSALLRKSDLVTESSNVPDNFSSNQLKIVHHLRNNLISSEIENQ